MRAKRIFVCLVLGVVTFVVSPDFDLGALVSTAEAVVGRPLTPVSYAGVARRTTRRAVAVQQPYPGYAW